MLGFDLPAGWEIVTPLVIGIGAMLVAIAHFIRKRADDPLPPHQTDFTPVLHRLDQQERAAAQRIESLARETARQIAEKAAEDRRYFDRIIDAIHRNRD